MLEFHLGDLLWCTDHLDVGLVLRAEPHVDTTTGKDEIFLEVQFSSGLTCITGDEESHGDYRRARRRSGTWEYEEDGGWKPIDFSESCFCDEPPTFNDDPDEGDLPDVGPRVDMVPYQVEDDEGGANPDEMA